MGDSPLGWTMGLEIAIPLVISAITTMAVSARSLLRLYSQQIVMLTRLDENVKIALVGLEALRIIDTDTNARLEGLTQRIEDVERYLQLVSKGEYPHPFTPRRGDKKP